MMYAAYFSPEERALLTQLPKWGAYDKLHWWIIRSKRRKNRSRKGIGMYGTGINLN